MIQRARRPSTAPSLAVLVAALLGVACASTDDQPFDLHVAEPMERAQLWVGGAESEVDRDDALEQIERAVEAVDEALEERGVEHPLAPEAAVLLGRAARVAARWGSPQARQLYERARALYPTSADLALLQARYLRVFRGVDPPVVEAWRPLAEARALVDEELGAAGREYDTGRSAADELAAEDADAGAALDLALDVRDDVENEVVDLRQGEGVPLLVPSDPDAFQVHVSLLLAGGVGERIPLTTDLQADLRALQEIDPTIAPEDLLRTLPYTESSAALRARFGAGPMVEVGWYGRAEDDHIPLSVAGGEPAYADLEYTSPYVVVEQALLSGVTDVLVRGSYRESERDLDSHGLFGVIEEDVSDASIGLELTRYLSSVKLSVTGTVGRAEIERDGNEDDRETWSVQVQGTVFPAVPDLVVQPVSPRGFSFFGGYAEDVQDFRASRIQRDESFAGMRWYDVPAESWDVGLLLTRVRSNDVEDADDSTSLAAALTAYWRAIDPNADPVPHWDADRSFFARFVPRAATLYTTLRYEPVTEGPDTFDNAGAEAGLVASFATGPGRATWTLSVGGEYRRYVEIDEDLSAFFVRLGTGL